MKKMIEIMDVIMKPNMKRRINSHGLVKYPNTFPKKIGGLRVRYAMSA